MGLLRVSPGTYTNYRAIENGIRYVTRTRKNENRRQELFAYGAIGASINPETAILEFTVVQKRLRESGCRGKLLFHEMFQLLREEVDLLKTDAVRLYNFARECAYYYYREGFQVVFAIHCDTQKGFHIHFVVNSVSFRNGKKWVDTYEGRNLRFELFMQILRKYQEGHIEVENRTEPIEAISFYERKDSVQNAYFSKKSETKKYYVVTQGRCCGVFDNWYHCKLQIEGCPYSKYRGFGSLNAAVIYINQEMELVDEYAAYLDNKMIYFPDYCKFIEYLEHKTYA